MRIFVLSLCVLFLGCASTTFEDLGKKIDSALHSKNEESSEQEPLISTYTLTVQAEPSDSTIKIMNIKPKYHDGIQLKAGAYDILVQRDGYQSHREWVSISNSDIKRNVELSLLAQQDVALVSPAATQELVKPQPAENSVTDSSKQTLPESQAIKLPAETEVAETQQNDKPVSEIPKTPNDQSESINEVASQSELTEKLRADYRPPKINQPSELIASEMTDDEQPKFNGAYIKVVDEGMFFDSVQLIEMEEKQAYRSVIFRAKPKESIGITWLTKQKKKYFALEELAGTITLPSEQFSGVIFKGEGADLVTLHQAERWVRSHDSDGGQSGAKAVFFDSNKQVSEGGAVYTPMDEAKMNKTKLSDDSYFVTFKQSPDKGLYICWVGSNFWFFNLI